MKYDAIHETVIADILDTIKQGLRMKDSLLKSKSNIRTANSITRATAGLTLVFPVLCSDTLSIDVAVMIAKAIERKNISLLQMAFSAYNITNAEDAISYLSQFHQNLDLDKLNLDKFMDIMDNLNEGVSMISKQDIMAIAEDCKRNLNYTFDDSINEESLLQYSQISNYGIPKIVKEANGKGSMKDTRSGMLYAQDSRTNKMRPMTNTEIETLANGVWPNNLNPNINGNPTPDEARKTIQWRNRGAEALKDEEKLTYKRELDKQDRVYQKQRDDIKDANDDRKYNLDALKAMGQAADQKRQYYQNQLLSSDIKKANEMQPSLMLINYYVNDEAKSLNIAQQAVAGVKSKLYSLASSDIINKIITKNIDNNTLLKFVKLSTREISFVKDFLLGIDDAKIDALSKSKKGSASKIFKALEKRAISGKIRKSLRMENAAKAITTLVISMEEVDELRKYQSIDVMQPRVIIPIMEKLNLLYFVVVDTTSEAIHILSDGDALYEEYSFTALERESGDGAYKKVINLMTKMV